MTGGYKSYGDGLGRYPNLKRETIEELLLWYKIVHYKKPVEIRFGDIFILMFDSYQELLSHVKNN